MSTLKIGIASYESMKARTLAIAGGRYKPAEDDPSVWFTSVESFAKVLSERNRELLALIARENRHRSPNWRRSRGETSPTSRAP